MRTFNKATFAMCLVGLLSAISIDAKADDFNGFDANSDKNVWKLANPQLHDNEECYSVEEIEGGYVLRFKKDYTAQDSPIWFDTTLGRDELEFDEVYDFSCHFETTGSLDRIELYFAAINNKWGDEIMFNQMTYIEAGKDNIFYTSRRCPVGGYDSRYCFFVIRPTIITIPANTELKITDICLIKHSDNTIVAPDPDRTLYEPFEQEGCRFEILSYATHEVSVKNVVESRPGYYEIPSSVTCGDTDYTITEIGEYAFVNQEFSSLIIPASVKKIGQYAFRNCSSLRQILMTSPVAPEVAYGAFVLAPTLHTMLYVPAGSIDNYTFAPGWCDFANIVEGETLAISTIPDEQPEGAAIYTIDGKTADASSPGLRIVDGRVVLNR